MAHDIGLSSALQSSAERPSSAAADVTIGDYSTTYFTAVSCSDWFGLMPLLVLYDLLSNGNTFKPQFGLDAFYTNTFSLQ